MILIWLDGGPPQHETYDPKPDAPAEFRGPLKAISTAVPGVQVSELLPEHARLLDKMSIIRSMYHDNGDHFAAAHWMLTGYLGSNAADLAPQYPSAGVDHHQAARAPGKQGFRLTSALPNTHSVGLVPGLPRGAPIWAWAITRLSPTATRIPSRTRFPTWACRAGVDGSRGPGPPRLAGRVRRRAARRRCLGPDGGPRPVRPRGILDRPGPRGPSGVRPQPGRSRGSATATAGTSGARAHCSPAGWSRRAFGSSRSRSAVGTFIPASKAA